MNWFGDLTRLNTKPGMFMFTLSVSISSSRSTKSPVSVILGDGGNERSSHKLHTLHELLESTLPFQVP
jgi:hypothetical protein